MELLFKSKIEKNIEKFREKTEKEIKGGRR